MASKETFSQANWWSRLTVYPGQYRVTWALGIMGLGYLSAETTTVAQARSELALLQDAYGFRPGETPDITAWLEDAAIKPMAGPE